MRFATHESMEKELTHQTTSLNHQLQEAIENFIINQEQTTQFLEDYGLVDNRQVKNKQ